MKRLLGLLLIGFMSVCSAANCFAELHPVDGSTNYLETDNPPVDANCMDLELIFARGSGAEYQTSDMWLAFRDTMNSYLMRQAYRYRIAEVEYPAVSVTEPFSNALGAFASAGEYYVFGRSVRVGVDWVKKYYNQVAQACPDTK